MERASAIAPTLVKVKYPDRVWIPYWRLIAAKYATLQELETHYSLVDVWEAMEAMALQSASDALNQQAYKDKPA